jgi:hypothetical protein
MSKEQKDWTIPNENNTIDVPDELMPLMNFFAFQMRLHKYSGQNEVLCIARMVKKAVEYAENNKSCPNCSCVNCVKSRQL